MRDRLSRRQHVDLYGSGLVQNLVGTRALIQLFNSLESLNHLSKSSEALSIGLTPAIKIKLRFVAHADKEAAV